ncbi:hypothetical protein [Microvirga sp. VF16]|uniref:hypothetical protein n=1 Tax=Microvirga sp. VF16 TaxID=2807101 RepID=UPI00193D7C59|nr:hypothetical protein [Microvirga sp. VF16]QRM29202.1 hypothetical protein JO965_24025 [Microvirga sp. VF16]
MPKLPQFIFDMTGLGVLSICLLSVTFLFVAIQVKTAPRLHADLHRWSLKDICDAYM